VRVQHKSECDECAARWVSGAVDCHFYAHSLPELSPTPVIRPHRSGYVFAAVVFLLGAIAWAIAQALGSIRSQSDLIVAWLVFGALALYVISELLGTAVPKVVVDGETVEVRNRLGRHRRFARSEVSHGAMRSIFAPRRYGNSRTNAFLLVSKDGLDQLASRIYGRLSPGLRSQYNERR